MVSHQTQEQAFVTLCLHSGAEGTRTEGTSLLRPSRPPLVFCLDGVNRMFDAVCRQNAGIDE